MLPRYFCIPKLNSQRLCRKKKSLKKALEICLSKSKSIRKNKVNFIITGTYETLGPCIMYLAFMIPMVAICTVPLAAVFAASSCYTLHR